MDLITAFIIRQFGTVASPICAPACGTPGIRPVLFSRRRWRVG